MQPGDRRPKRLLRQQCGDLTLVKARPSGDDGEQRALPFSGQRRIRAVTIAER
jgi:hypothetical protein